MYERLYNLSAAPFLATPHPRLLFGSHCHSGAIPMWCKGLAQQGRFIVIADEFGAGTATLVGPAWKQLEWIYCVTTGVGTTQASGDDLQRLAMMSIARGDIPDTEKANTLRRLTHMLRGQ